MKLKHMVSLLLALLCIVALTACSSTTVTTNESGAQGPGVFFYEESFDSPEAAMDAFAAGLAAGDLTQALSACSFLSAAEGYDFWAFVDRIQVYNITNSMRVPSEGPLFTDLNTLYRLNHLQGQIGHLTMSLLLSNEEMERYAGTVVSLSDAAARSQLEATMAKLDVSRLEGLKIYGICKPGAIHDDERTQENFAAQAATFGADEKVERFVIYELDGNFMIGGASFLRYGDDWKIEGFNSNLAGTNAYGYAVHLEGFTAAEADELLEGFAGPS